MDGEAFMSHWISRVEYIGGSWKRAAIRSLPIPGCRIRLRNAPGSSGARLTLTPPHGSHTRASRLAQDLVVASTGTLGMLAQIEAYAGASTPVVFVGETGTGKSYFASQLHRLSGRRGPFLDLPAGELDPALAADQLFGHVRGAYTGAGAARTGRLAAARDGTVLLDDFHLLRRSAQYLLLRAFERRVFQQVGSDREVALACRLVVGVGVDPDVLVRRGRLLPDLRGRLGHCVIRLPSLAERRDEILPLARRFLERAPETTSIAGGPVGLDPVLEAVLEVLDYPLNVRDLRGVIEAAYLHGAAAGARLLTVGHLPAGVRCSLMFHSCGTTRRALGVVAMALRRSQGRVGEAARLIGVSRNTVTAWKRRLEAGTR